MTTRKKIGITIFKYFARPILMAISNLFEIGFKIEIILDDEAMVNELNKKQAEELLSFLTQLRHDMTKQDTTLPKA